ncbi:hypothetical protein IQ268_23295 [Oculatella sp. LEGE 06141]|nr:hypothetical protein [Oculatella sp. LEGE 06141]
MAKLKIVEQFDSRFSLEPEAQATLFKLLTSDSFCQQVSQQTKCDTVEFTEMLFQPVPYSLNATKGMPVEYEQYHQSPDYAIINVPPNFMFTAKIFQPSRLCAIYRKLTRET